MMSRKEEPRYRPQTSIDNSVIDLPKIKSTPTDYKISLTSKVAKNVPYFEEDEIDVKVDKNNTLVSLNVINAITDEPITQFDMTVHNTVCALYQEGNTHITANQVAKKLIGVKVKKNHVDIVNQSIYKMSKTHIFINHEEQFKNWKKADEMTEDDYVTSRSSYMLNISIEQRFYLNNNKVTHGFVINETPPLYEYSVLYRQIASTKDKLIKTSGFINKYDETTIGLEGFLVERIEMFLNARRNNNKKLNTTTITYKDMYKNLGKESLLTGRSEYRKRFINIVTNILDAYKYNGFIKSYTQEGNYINGKIIIGKIKDKEKYI